MKARLIHRTVNTMVNTVQESLRDIYNSPFGAYEVDLIVIIRHDYGRGFVTVTAYCVLKTGTTIPHVSWRVKMWCLWFIANWNRIFAHSDVFWHPFLYDEGRCSIFSLRYWTNHFLCTRLSVGVTVAFLSSTHTRVALYTAREAVPFLKPVFK